MKNKEIYKDKFYDDRKGVSDSAEVIVPIILKLVKPKSVVDVGCATGEFLKIFEMKGVKNILGLDGDWIDKNRLCISKELFKTIDLNNPSKINKKFDLVISLETAEHLPKENAKDFVSFLTSLGKIVIFSGAVVGQGGINHLNEQYQKYWADLFKREGYVVVDFLRRKIWDDERVFFYYAQNILMYIKEEHINNNENIKKEFEQTNPSFISIIHPKLYNPVIEKQKLVGKFLPKPIKYIIGKLLSKMKVHNLNQRSKDGD